ncbi:MAG: tetratricopeptide repeat protein [Chloroflexi bacterium]|nr:tetratricopeptide repeat protein [Chloroflexota bacterium]
MMLWHAARDLTRRLPKWERPAKASLAIALPLLILLLGIGFFGPESVQLPARLGAFGLLITIQLLFLWANRRDASPYHQAQQHFIAGEYQAASDLLETMPERERASVDALVLLGNTYRNLGNFGLAQAALNHALELNSRHHLALFSAGKLQLVQGNYLEASEYFKRAIQAGAPALVRFELGQAHFLLGDHDEALRHLKAARPALADDPAQSLLLQYHLHTMHGSDMPASEFIQENIQFWRAEALKYSETPYGARLAEAIAVLGAEIEER